MVVVCEFVLGVAALNERGSRVEFTHPTLLLVGGPRKRCLPLLVGELYPELTAKRWFAGCQLPKLPCKP